MKSFPRIFLFIGIVCFAAVSFGNASDTTYSQTRTAVKKHQKKDKEPDNNKPPQEEIDTSFCGSCCGQFIGEVFSQAMHGMFVHSFQMLFVGDSSSEVRSKRRFHVLLGAGLGMPFTFGYAIGGQGQISMGPLLFLGRQCGLSANLSYAGSSSALFRDFQRDVFVDGAFIGVQTDVTLKYSVRETACLFEFLYFPVSDDGSLFYSGGFGVKRCQETVKIRREFLETSTVMHVNSDELLPAVRVSIGRFSEGGRGIFSVAYDVVVNKNRKEMSTPRDNALVSQSISLLWIWVL
ncbi:MAG: hypothetical protein JW795_18300 [Chitinivibrionales bacterium]|nr:hypothetical protein [Chitinivibrionales bacterium]